MDIALAKDPSACNFLIICLLNILYVMFKSGFFQAFSARTLDLAGCSVAQWICKRSTVPIACLIPRYANKELLVLELVSNHF